MNAQTAVLEMADFRGGRGANRILQLCEQDIPLLEDRSAAVVAGERARLCRRATSAGNRRLIRRW
jgi:hypothetical protein